MDGHPPENPADVICRIAARRITAGDSAVEVMPEDAEGAIAWVVKHPATSPKMAAEDTLDCLRLVHWLHVTADHRELSLLHRVHSRKVPVTWETAARALGLNTRQGAQARYMRLESRRAGLDEHTETAMRQHLAAAASKEEWLAAHRERIVRIAEEMVAATPDGAPELAEELDEGNPLDVMIYMRYAINAYPPGLCPPAEALVAEWDTLAR